MYKACLFHTIRRLSTSRLAKSTITSHFATMSSSHTLPKGFLEGPAPNLKRSDVNFTKGRMPEYEGCWAVVLDGVMSKEECDQLVTAAEATTNGTWERALVNIGGGMQAMIEDTRKCGRIIWDDRDIMTKLWARIGASVPEIHRLEKWASVTGNGPAKRNEVWKATRLNERARFLKYNGGEYFKAHCDGTYETPDRKERSYFTLHLYLNDPDGKDGQEPLEGGATTFHSWNMQERIDVVPKCGRVLMFQHRDLLHSGDDVVSGTKLTMRTDLMYAMEVPESK
ncbi:oxidoreductase domain-containing protein [Ophiobolus disseminans]|uniref:Oxidoreductase domain-containing protein n=1 Tax=Ophiobolus disseminans TaxID=1469910 RepID=A0A6A6ZGR6_9PLEO|nr:oxidoreductase domain-containing protein [Ophiobolus disseminans]